MGPWTHTLIGSANSFGDIAFGPEAAINLPDVHLRWYDQRLRGIHNGTDEEAPVRIFVMGENAWRFEQEWPLVRTQYRRFYLHSSGRANSLHGDGHLNTEPSKSEAADCFDYDPADPVPTLGDQSMLSTSTGPKDRRPLQRRDDVLVYSSQPLSQDLEITGPVQLTLCAASTAPDTDFTATLVDVHPGGPAINICEGIVRARFRESYESPTLIQPGSVYQYQIHLWETSNLFKAGHRICLEVSSSNFPRFDRNQNKGTPLGLDAEIQIARQAIHHSQEHPSYLTLPVIPRE